MPHVAGLSEKMRAVCLLYSVAACVCLYPGTSAFIPKKLYEVLSQSFNAQSHVELTENAILITTAKYFNSLPLPESKLIPTDKPIAAEDMFNAYYGKRVPTSDFANAVQDIAQANAAVDTRDDTKDDPTWHFDCEQFELGNNNLKQLWQAIYVAAKNGHYSQARALTGQYLHPMQDFYSHSNWIEMGKTDPNDALGQEGQILGRVAPVEMYTCSECIPTVLSPFECRGNIIDSVNKAGYLTSGYYGGSRIGSTEILKPVGKCSHGGERDTTRKLPSRGGINKDTTNSVYAPHHYLHKQASDVALMATLHLFDRIRTAIRDEKFAEYLNLNQAGQSLTFVIDTTRSMGKYLEAAKQRCLQLVELSQTSSDTPKNYILVPLYNFLVGAAVRTASSDEFKKQLASLSKANLGDLFNPPTFGGILLAAEFSEWRSAIFVFTDKPAKDMFLYQPVVAAVSRKQQSVYFVTEQPGTLDPLYSSLADVSGGRLMVNSDNVSNVFIKRQTTRFVVEQGSGDSVLLANLRNVQVTKKTLTLEVDSLLTDLEVLVGHNNATPHVTLNAPNGKQLLPTDNATGSSNMKLFKVAHPVVGTWNITIEMVTTGWFAEIRGKSAFDTLSSFEHIDNEITRYPGPKELRNNPLVDDKLLLTVRSTNKNCRLTTAKFLNTNGSMIKEAHLLVTDDPHHYSSNVTIPDHPFQIEVSGIAENGTAFQRLQATQVTPTRIRLNITAGDNTIDQMALGAEKNITLTIRNEGLSGHFEVSATDTFGLVVDYQPRAFVLTANQSITAYVHLVVPPTATAGRLSSFIISVGPSSNISLHDANFFRKTISIVSGKADHNPPTCEIISTNFNTSCLTNNKTDCKSQKWKAEVVFEETGSGVDGIFVTNSGVGEVNWSLSKDFTALGPASATGIASATCCVLSATFTIVNSVGLTGQCVVRH